MCQDTETGYVPNGAPWHPGCGGGVPWGAAMTLIPWEYYLHYGDISVLEEHYDAMAAQLAHMERWWVEQGADTFWEQWNGENSRNHPMFGGGLSWLYTRVAGLQADPLEPGYKHMIVRPLPLGDLTSASYGTQTAFGKAAVSWTLSGGEFRLQLRVPKGSRASVYLPGAEEPMELKAGSHRLSAQI